MGTIRIAMGNQRDFVLVYPTPGEKLTAMAITPPQTMKLAGCEAICERAD
jgi:hypothetical protein